MQQLCYTGKRFLQKCSVSISTQEDFTLSSLHCDIFRDEGVKNKTQIVKRGETDGNYVGLAD